MRHAAQRLTELVRHPDTGVDASLGDWDLLIRQARHSSLLSRLGWLMQGSGRIDALPPQVAMHLRSALRVADKQARVVRFELSRIETALRPLDAPVMVLKGAAYVGAQLPPAGGRIFSDIDILVPKAHLDEAERYMIRAGWMTTHHDEYDQRYYRNWMHELPPMKHGRRGTVVDMHHTILPETARLHPDPEKLLARRQPLPGYRHLYTLSNVDMVLHSATHLFHDGELENGLRDLVDLDALLRHFGTTDGFWDELVERAAELELGRPLHYALRYTTRFLQTPVPEVARKGAAALGRPAAPQSHLMDTLLRRALMPDHISCDDALTPLARWLLYVRSHYLRMPLHLLLPHLVRKAVKTPQGPAAPMQAPEVEGEKG